MGKTSTHKHKARYVVLLRRQRQVPALHLLCRHANCRGSSVLSCARACLKC